jgi:CheY-like chemotaxis protein
MNADAVKTILYVEDNLFNLHLVKAILASRPHLRLLTATHGKLGLEMARQKCPDLILLDMHLPDMVGPQFLRELRAEPALTEVPVVIVTGDELSEQRAECADLGVVAFVTKPFDIDQLRNLIERCVAD